MKKDYDIIHLIPILRDTIKDNVKPNNMELLKQ